MARLAEGPIRSTRVMRVNINALIEDLTVPYQPIASATSTVIWCL